MADAIDPHSEREGKVPTAAAEVAPATPRGATPVVQTVQHAAPAAAGTPGSPEERPAPKQAAHPWRKRLLLLALAGGLVYGAYALAPAIKTALITISTDDAYVDGHVTFVAVRVPGQVTEVLVDDNMRVKKGSILVQLDKEPYQVKLAIKQRSSRCGRSRPYGGQCQGARDRRPGSCRIGSSSSVPSKTSIPRSPSCE